MIAPVPSPGFVADLRAYDPQLRVRWGHRMALWIIERKLPERHKQLLAEKATPWKSSRGLDLWDGWKEGYVHVMNVHPDLLAWTLVGTELRKADFQALGGVAALNRALDADEDAWERETDRAIANYTQAGASEMFDRLAWLDGRRVAVPNLERVVPRFVETAHEGFTVRDRRVTT